MELGHSNVVVNTLVQFLAAIHSIIKPGPKNFVANIILGQVLLVLNGIVYLCGNVVEIA